MKNLTNSQESILNKLLPKLIKTEPYEELLRVSSLFREIKEIEKDGVLFDQFKTIINNQLYFYLKSKEAFYDLNRFKDIYETLLVKEFTEDNFDADENDFIEGYINSQQEIINKTIEYFIPVNDYEPLELIQFLKKDFFDKINFTFQHTVTPKQKSKTRRRRTIWSEFTTSIRDSSIEYRELKYNKYNASKEN